MQKQRRYDGVVMGPDGNPLTLDDLPPAGTTRWVIRRKAEVVAAVRGGLLTMEDACQRYGLSEEEFDGWRKSIEKHGLPGLHGVVEREGAGGGGAQRLRQPLGRALEGSVRGLRRHHRDRDRPRLLPRRRGAGEARQEEEEEPLTKQLHCWSRATRSP